MLLVQSITIVLMMVEFALVLLMSLVLNVIHVKLVGMVFHLVKVRYIFAGVVPVAHQKYAHRKMPTTICPRPFAHQIHKPTAKSPPKPKAHRQLPTDKCPRQKAHQWLWANIRGQIAVGK